MDCDPSTIFADGAIDEIKLGKTNSDLASCEVIISDSSVTISTDTDNYQQAYERFIRCFCNFGAYGKFTSAGNRVTANMGSYMTEFIPFDMHCDGQKTLTICDKDSDVKMHNVRVIKSPIKEESRKRCIVPEMANFLAMTHIPHPPKVSIAIKYFNKAERNGICIQQSAKYVSFYGVMDAMYSYGHIYSIMMNMMQKAIEDIICHESARNEPICSKEIMDFTEIHGIPVVEYVVRKSIAAAMEFSERVLGPDAPEVLFEHPTVRETVTLADRPIDITCEIDWKGTYE